MSSMMRIDESLAAMAEAAQKSAAAQERRAAAEERRADADERCAVATERYAAAAERAALVAEENLRDGRASRVELHAFFDKLAAELLPVVTAKIESALGASAEQSEEEEAEEEEDEGQQPVPVAVEAPAKPEPAAKAEPAPAPVEAKQEKKEEPAAPIAVEVSEPEAKAELGAELPVLDAADYIKRLRELNLKYPLSEDLRRHVQNGVREALGLQAMVRCEPNMRRYVVEKYEAALKRIEKEGLTAEAPSETA